MGLIYDFQVWFHKKIKRFLPRGKFEIVEGFPKEERIRPKAEKCENCNNKITDLTGFFCNYCKKWHCGKHRLPENHKCSNPKLPPEMNGYRVTYGKK
jgi:hypothetical protein